MVKINYFIIPLCVFLTALVGSLLTSGGMEWYQSTQIPSWTPSGSVIGAVWTILFILIALSLFVFWNKTPHTGTFSHILTFFIINAILNVGWSFFFFNQHWIGVAVGGALALGVSVIVLIFLLWPKSRIASLLLVPYAGWVFFASYLTYNIWLLNR